MAQPDPPDAPAPTDAAQRLMHAIRAGDEGRVEAALRDGASANTTTTVEGGEFDNTSAGAMSALMLAIKLGNIQAAARLLEAGADVHWVRPHNGVGAAYIAAGYGHTEVVRLLAKAGANVNTPSNNGVTPACIAA